LDDLEEDGSTVEGLTMIVVGLRKYLVDDDDEEDDENMVVVFRAAVVGFFVESLTLAAKIGPP
jgi:chemotaxis signal transduction protein